MGKASVIPYNFEIERNYCKKTINLPGYLGLEIATFLTFSVFLTLGKDSDRSQSCSAE